MCYIDIIGWSVRVVRQAMYGQGLFMLKYSMGEGIGIYYYYYLLYILRSV